MITHPFSKRAHFSEYIRASHFVFFRLLFLWAAPNDILVDRFPFRGHARVGACNDVMTRGNLSWAPVMARDNLLFGSIWDVGLKVAKTTEGLKFSESVTSQEGGGL